LLLHVLLEARVEIADDGRETDDLFAVQLHDEAEDAVSRRVVRAEVDLENVAFFAEGGIDLEHGGNRRRDPGPFVDLRPLDYNHCPIPRSRSAPARRRADSPCAADALPSPLP